MLKALMPSVVEEVDPVLDRDEDAARVLDHGDGLVGHLHGSGEAREVGDDDAVQLAVLDETEKLLELRALAPVGTG